jgi:outer membrane protein OmpU
MKKILIASTALVMAAGVAQADTANFTLSGGSYFGLGYYSKPATGVRKTQLLARTQVDIKGSKTTDSGLTFYGKFRIRSNAYQSGPAVLSSTATGGHTNSGTTTVNAGQVGVTAGGLDVAVGNVADAVDASSLYYNSEVGICGCGGETLRAGIEGYSSTGGGNNGVLVTYTMGSLIMRAGYQSNGNTTNANGEASVSVDYSAGAFKVGAGYLHQKGTGGEYTVQAEYGFGNSTVGVAAGHGFNNAGNIYTLYGSTTFGATTVQAFVSSRQKLVAALGETEKTTYGIGAKYDLGSGASIVGSVRRDEFKATYADIGAEFAF